MKLIYFTPLLSTKGGQERTLTDKANYLAGHGHEVMFLTYEHDGPLAYLLSPAVKHVDLHCHFFLLYSFSLCRRFVEAFRLKRLFRQRIKDVITKYRPDIIVITVPNTENFISDVMQVKKGIPVIVESHLAQGRQVIRRGMTENWLYCLYNPLKAIKKSDLLISLTTEDAKCWNRLGVKNVKVIPNPVTSYFDALPEVTKQEGRIICVGRLTPQKRFDRLISAFSLIASKYPDWYVDIYGAGEEFDKLLSLISNSPCSDQIHLLSPVSDIYGEYLRSQFFVLSSDFEGFGLVIVEAMACGIPVISTNCPFGPSEIIDDYKSGLLAKMDVKDLAEKMEWMITHDEERKLMGLNAHQAAARYRKEIIMPQWEEAYLSVIKS